MKDRLFVSGDLLSPVFVSFAKRNGLAIDQACTPTELNRALQKSHWLRGLGTCRRTMRLLAPTPPTDFDLADLRLLGFEDAFPAKPGNYKGVLLLGATLPRVVDRLKFLLAQEDISYPVIWLLGSNRPLNPESESRSKIIESIEAFPLSKDRKDVEVIRTEIDLMFWICQQIALPKGICAVPIGTSETSNPGGRVNTADTIANWVQTARPKQGEYLVSSSQPHVMYQDLVVKNIVRDNTMAWVSTNTIGRADRTNIPLAEYLDAIARYMYELARS